MHGFNNPAINHLPMLKISIATSIFPTEDTERVNNAVMNLFPDANIEIESDKLIAVCDNLDYLVQGIAKQKIRDSTRRYFMGQIKEPGLVFHINKQAALMGKINFTDGKSIMGDIEVSISTDNPDELIESMTYRELDE